MISSLFDVQQHPGNVLVALVSPTTNLFADSLKNVKSFVTEDL